MLRHSCALRWYAIGGWPMRSVSLTSLRREAKDFRQQFGDTWDLVAAYLGHRNPENHQTDLSGAVPALDVEILLQHAQDSAVQAFLADYLADHPLVRTDPLRHNTMTGPSNGRRASCRLRDTVRWNASRGNEGLVVRFVPEDPASSPSF